MPRLLLLASFVAGCASAPAGGGAADLDAALHRWTSRRSAPSVSVRRERSARVPITPAPPTDPLARGPVIDVRFREAPLAGALSLLAESAGLNLVIGDGVEGSVSVDLRRVRPWNAMHALAEAHHVVLRRVGRTVIARGR